jgi:hypothetical protein
MPTLSTSIIINYSITTLSYESISLNCISIFKFIVFIFKCFESIFISFIFISLISLFHFIIVTLFIHFFLITLLINLSSLSPAIINHSSILILSHNYLSAMSIHLSIIYSFKSTINCPLSYVLSLPSLYSIVSLVTQFSISFLYVHFIVVYIWLVQCLIFRIISFFLTTIYSVQSFVVYVPFIQILVDLSKLIFKNIDDLSLCIFLYFFIWNFHLI